MEILKHFKSLKASSLIESVIAITIISTSLLVAFLIYLNVIKQNYSTAFYNASHHIELLTYEVLDERDYADNSYKFNNYSIIKEVILNKEAGIAELKWTIKTKNRTQSIKKVIPYYYD